MRETPRQRIKSYLEDDALMGDVLNWSAQAPAPWEASRPGLALRQLRWRMGFSQRALAEAVGLTQGHVQRVEAGLDCRLSTLRRLLGARGFEPMLALKRLGGESPAGPKGL